MLVFAVLLGYLAGDRWILRLAGLGWPHLLAVHRRRNVLAGAAALALAEAGLLAALVTGILPPLLQQLGVSAPTP